MTREDPFVELAKDCVRACHVLKSMKEGTDVDNVNGGPSEERLEDLGRCVNQAQLT